MDDEYEKFIRRMNPPRVVIDNESCKNATIIQVDSANKYGTLLEVVQVLTDLNLTITKAYICSDGEWFMDVFNVTDQDGNKITDEGTLNYIEKIRAYITNPSKFNPQFDPQIVKNRFRRITETMGASESREDASTCQKTEEERDESIKGIAALAVLTLAAWGLCKILGGSEPERKTMKAPGRDYRIFRDDFERDPADHFRRLL